MQLFLHAEDFIKLELYSILMLLENIVPFGCIGLRAFQTDVARACYRVCSNLKVT
jgi:hypothetical protein